MFKKWHAPLKYIFNNYSKDFVSTRARSKDFTALSELSGGLTVGDWMIFCRDFRFVPHLMNKTQSLALFHLSNTELGVQDTELGARGGQQILSYNEFISCLRGVAMGEAFRQLPTMKERVIALGAFMRRQAYFFGPKKHGRPQDRFKVDTGSLKRRMGDIPVWQKKRPPLVEYIHHVPPALRLPDAIRIALEIVDLICSKAEHIHFLTLCPVQLESLEDEVEEAWAPKEQKPVDPRVLDRLFTEPTSKQKAPKPIQKKVYGMGGSFVPPPKSVRVKRKGKRRFGDRTIGKLPLRHVHAAKTCIEIIKEIADGCVTGRCRKKLEAIYEIEGKTGGEQIQEAIRKKGLPRGTVITLSTTKGKKLPPKPDLHPKESEKSTTRHKREKQNDLRKRDRDKIKMKARQEELRLIIEEQKKAKQAKIDADMKAKTEIENQTKEARKSKKKKKQDEDKKRRDNIKKWRKDKKQAALDEKNSNKVVFKKRKYVNKIAL